MKRMMIIFLMMLALPGISVEAARQKKNATEKASPTYITETDLTAAEVKKLSEKNGAFVDEITLVLTNANNAKLEMLRDGVQKLSTKSDVFNQIFTTLANTLRGVRDATAYDENFKAAQQSLKDTLDMVVERVEKTNVSHKVKRAFVDIRDAINDAVEKKAEAISGGMSKEGWFAGFFKSKKKTTKVKPEHVAETPSVVKKATKRKAPTKKSTTKKSTKGSESKVS